MYLVVNSYSFVNEAKVIYLLAFKYLVLVVKG